MDKRCRALAAAAALRMRHRILLCRAQFAPSGLTNRVASLFRTPALYQGLAPIVDAYYDVGADSKGPSQFFHNGFFGALPITIQNMPEQQLAQSTDLVTAVSASSTMQRRT